MAMPPKRFIDPEEFAARYRRPDWQEKRLIAFDYYGGRCLDCGKKFKVADTDWQVHHLTYATFGFEEPCRDLVLLCRECHEKREWQKKANKDKRDQHRREYVEERKQAQNVATNEWLSDFLDWVYPQQDVTHGGKYNLMRFDIYDALLRDYIDSGGIDPTHHTICVWKMRTHDYVNAQRIRNAVYLRNEKHLSINKISKILRTSYDRVKAWCDNPNALDLANELEIYAKEGVKTWLNSNR